MHASIPTRFRTHAAFTLIEVTIVVIIMAILAVSLALAYQSIQLKVRYDSNVNQIAELFQQARSLSLSSLMINDTDPTYYYILNVDEGAATLTAYSTDTSVNEVIDTFTYDSDMNITTPAIEVYYFPPNGAICFGVYTCTSTDTENSVTFEDSEGTYSTQFTITKAGGYVEVE